MVQGDESGKGTPVTGRQRLASLRLPSTRLLPNPLRNVTSGTAAETVHENKGGLRARLRRGIDSIRSSRRIASVSLLLKNSTAWEEEIFQEEWLTSHMQPPGKLMGSSRLARAVAIMGGWTGLQDRHTAGSLYTEFRTVKLGSGTVMRVPISADKQSERVGVTPNISTATTGATAIDKQSERVGVTPNISTATTGATAIAPLPRLQDELTNLVLAETKDDEFSVTSEGSENENKIYASWLLLIQDWTEAIAEAYGKPEPLSTHRASAAAPAPLAPLAMPSHRQPSSPPDNNSSIDPKLKTLRKWVNEYQNAELTYLSDYDLSRYLSLRKGDASKALATLLAHHNWLNSPGYGVDKVADVNPQTAGMKEQIRSGKCFLLNNCDFKGRPVVMVRAHKHDPTASR
jgi:hypothetical protein